MKLPDYPNASAPMSKAWLVQWLKEAVDYLRASKAMPSPDIWPDEKPAGTTFRFAPGTNGGGGAAGKGRFLAAVQTDFQTGTQISVKVCDANGNTTAASSVISTNIYSYTGPWN
jgi:hypothetical protein